MGMRKAFPNDRNYDFWNILACHIIHTQHDVVSDKERMMFGTLAYRMILKAAEAVTTDKVSLL
jgi:N-terminal acetyltransferase B complex non-catalytic subunit